MLENLNGSLAISLILLLFSANHLYATGERFVFGDNKGTAAATVQTPRPGLWKTTQAGDTITLKSDSTLAYSGKIYCHMAYDLASLEINTQVPIDWAGFGWEWRGTPVQDLSGATHLKFAYKLSEASHRLRFSINCVDSSTITCLDSMYDDSSADSICIGTVPQDNYINYEYGGGGQPEWKLDSIDLTQFGAPLILGTVNQIDVSVEYAGTDKSVTMGSLDIDEICFTNVAAVAVKKPWNIGETPSAQARFTRTGFAKVRFFSISGKMIATHFVKVFAGESVDKVTMRAHPLVYGACVAQVRGMGVDKVYRIMQ